VRFSTYYGVTLVSSRVEGRCHSEERSDEESISLSNAHSEMLRGVYPEAYRRTQHDRHGKICSFGETLNKRDPLELQR
jgi:hypothetical protein